MKRSWVRPTPRCWKESPWAAGGGARHGHPRHLGGGALAAGRDDLAERWERVFTDPAGWVLVNTTPRVSVAAARLQHRCGLAAGPALDLAAALEGGATAMISHDRDSLLVGDPPLVPPLLPVLSALIPVL